MAIYGSFSLGVFVPVILLAVLSEEAEWGEREKDKEKENAF